MSAYPAGAGYPSRRSVAVECRNDDCPGLSHIGFTLAPVRWTGILRDNGLGFTELLEPTNQCPDCGGTDVEIT